MSTIDFLSSANDSSKNWLARPIAGLAILKRQITPAAILLSAIVLLSIGLHFYNLQSIGTSNAYYTAAVKSMLQSWHNFFFVAAEPGGSVTVDKPPLGLWIETAFAAVLGVSGFSVVLPNLLAGVLSVPLLYHLVKKYFGAAAGLVAALVLAVTPVSLAVDRNNTIDSMLILTLLLAAWAFLVATETGRLRYLLLGVFLVGLGFNIKMLQAFLPLPAFYALYFFGSKIKWPLKLLNLGLASLLLVVVSLAWAVAVDLTPASQRPYIGSTSGNSEMELIFGYNGINRLLGMMGGRMPGDGRNAPPSAAQSGRAAFPSALQAGSGQTAGSTFQGPPGQDGRGFGPQNGGPGGVPLGGSSGGMFGTGTPGVLRFFQSSLANEMSWLLPFALLAVLLAAVSSGRIRVPLLANEHKALILWGGWLVTCLVFFSIAGFFHTYYLATLSPALGAVVGVGYSSLEKLRGRSRLLGVLVWLVMAGATLAFQLYLVKTYGLTGIWAGLAVALFALAAVISLLGLLPSGGHGLPGALVQHRTVIFSLTSLVLLGAMLVIPAIWSVRTVAESGGSMLPAAYSGDNSGSLGGPGAFQGGFAARPAGNNNSGGQGGGVSEAMLTYLQANTKNTKYLLAVPSSNVGSNIVLETGRPVLFVGGFSGSDPVVNASGLAKLVANGELRYILYGGQGGGPGGSSDIASWLNSTCQTVSDFTQSSGQNQPGRGGFGSTLYLCQKNG
ncbi:MAG: glycosyltransferase family 39 protein [Anaerolineaceae bacterium]|nr:glycosyltransferase family 39 protein [Anaerolineaceae bacterium]